MTVRFGVVVVSIACAFGCGSTVAEGSPPEEPGGTPAAGSGAKPPDFELDGLRGGTVRLSDYLGKNVILIDFWATFCEPCLAAMPQLDTLYEKYKARGFVVFGVSIDGPASIAQVRSEVEKLAVDFPILLDQETRVVSLYNPRVSAPYSVLIGRDGRIVKKKEGYVTGDAAQLEADIVAALK